MTSIQTEYENLIRELSKVYEHTVSLKKQLSSLEKNYNSFFDMFIKNSPASSVNNCARAIQSSMQALQKETEEELKKLALIEEYMDICDQQSILRSASVQLTLLLKKAGAKNTDHLSQRLMNGSIDEAISTYNRRVSELRQASVEPEALLRLLSIQDKETDAQLSFDFAKVEKGSVIKFGTYPQEKQGQDKVPIEWIVIAKENSRILVISKNAIDSQRYNQVKVSTTWETSSIREWLNDKFLTFAFSPNERKMIPTVPVIAEPNQTSYKKTKPGKSTKDKIFLLSYNEIKKYFRLTESRKCIPTAYAIAQGTSAEYDGEKTKGTAYCWWWLRSSGSSPDHASIIDSSGSARSDGYVVNSTKGGVRPVLWIENNQ